MIEEGDVIKVVECGIAHKRGTDEGRAWAAENNPKLLTEPHYPHFWHNGRRFCMAGEVLSGEWDVAEILTEAQR